MPGLNGVENLGLPDTGVALRRGVIPRDVIDLWGVVRACDESTRRGVEKPAVEATMGVAIRWFGPDAMLSVEVER